MHLFILLWCICVFVLFLNVPAILNISAMLTYLLIAELILLTVLARLIMQFSDDRSIAGYSQPEFVNEKKVLC